MLALSGAGLFFLPDETRPLWPWEIGPFNALFLGAIYLASVGALVLVARSGRWEPARVVLPMVFTFAAVVLLASLFYLGRFIPAHWTTWAWFAIFVGNVAYSGYFLWRYRLVWPRAAYETTGRWRSLLLIVAALAWLYGIGLFLLPGPLAAFWPWPIDAFHARVYSGGFTTLGVGALALSQYAAPLERLTVGLTYSLLGLFAVFGVVIVDSRTHSVAWGAPGTWLWLAIFGASFAMGLSLIWWASSTRETAR